MAGRPKLHELRKRVEDAARAEGMSGADWVFARVSDGESPLKIAKSLGVGRTTILDLIKKYDPDGERLRAARVVAAGAHADEAGAVLDELVGKVLFSPADIALAKERANHHKWLAGLYDRETYGEKKEQPQLVLNVGTLHLEALRAQRPVEALPAAPVVEAEVVGVGPS